MLFKVSIPSGAQVFQAKSTIGLNAGFINFTVLTDKNINHRNYRCV